MSTTSAQGRSPDLYEEDYMEQVRDRVARFGHMVQYVRANNEIGMPGFAYTVGLSNFFTSELIVIGLDLKTSSHVLNHIAEKLKSGQLVIKDGNLISGLFGVDLRMDVPSPQQIAMHFMSIALDFACERSNTISAVQIVFPDKDGLFPNDRGCNPEIAGLQNLKWHYEHEIGLQGVKPGALNRPQVN